MPLSSRMNEKLVQTTATTVAAAATTTSKKTFIANNRFKYLQQRDPGMRMKRIYFCRPRIGWNRSGGANLGRDERVDGNKVYLPDFAICRLVVISKY